MREASERASFRCAFKTSEACVRVVTISVGGFGGRESCGKMADLPLDVVRPERIESSAVDCTTPLLLIYEFRDYRIHMLAIKVWNIGSCN